MKKWIWIAMAAAGSLASARADEPGTRAACYQTRWRAAETEVRPAEKAVAMPELPPPPIRAASLCGPLPAVLPVSLLPLSEPSPIRQASYAALGNPPGKIDPVRLPATVLVPESDSSLPKAWLQKPVLRPTGPAETTAVRGPIRAISQE